MRCTHLVHRINEQHFSKICAASTSEAPNEKVTELKLRLMSRYGEFSGEGSASEINEALIVETKHWLYEFPEVKKI